MPTIEAASSGSTSWAASACMARGPAQQRNASAASPSTVRSRALAPFQRRRRCPRGAAGKGADAVVDADEAQDIQPAQADREPGGGVAGPLTGEQAEGGVFAADAQPRRDRRARGFDRQRVRAGDDVVA